MKKKYLLKYENAYQGGFITDDGFPYYMTVETVWFGLFKTIKKVLIWLPLMYNEGKQKAIWDRWISEKIPLKSS